MGIMVIWLAGVCVLTALASLICCRILIAIAPKDAPDAARKTQTIAVPTSGGLAIAAAIALVLGGLTLGDKTLGGVVPAGPVWTYVALAIFVLILGAVDDAKDLPAKPKLFALLAATCLAAYFGLRSERIFLPIADSIILLPLWLAVSGTALWVFTVMNASNFMDGSNGLSLGTLAIMIGATGFALPTPLSAAAAITTSAIVGFLFWNLQGRLYAGDAGALFGGAVFAGLGLYAAREGNIWLPATLALPLLIDVFMTLAWRAKRGQNLLKPHRHHAYQGLIKSGWSHIGTALLWWGFALICAACALWAAADSKAMSAYVFLGLLSAGCTLWLIHRARLPEALKQME